MSTTTIPIVMLATTALAGFLVAFGMARGRARTVFVGCGVLLAGDIAVGVLRGLT